MGILVCLFGSFQEVQSATAKWIGGSGDWGDTTHWSSGLVPGASDDVQISSLSAGQTITISSGENLVDSIRSDSVLQFSGGTLRVSTTLLVNNTILLNGGTIAGGTLQVGSGGGFVVSSGTLDGVMVNGDLDVGSTVNGAALTVVNGLVLNGRMSVGNPTNSTYGHAVFNGNQVFGGKAEVIFGNQPNYNAIMIGSAATTVVLGPQVKIHGAVGWLGNNPWMGGAADGKFVNQGTISADSSGLAITIGGGGIINSGVMEAVNGGILQAATGIENSGRITVETGRMTIANGFSQVTGVLDFGLNSLSDFGRINFSGTATVGGSLAAHLGANYTPNIGDSFPVLILGNNTLSVTNLNLPKSNVWNINLNDGILNLIVTDTLPLAATISPSDMTIPVGAPISLQAIVTGTGPFGFQWLRNAAPIAGATNAIFELTNAQQVNSGTYTVHVSNRAGSLSSAPAIVKVLAAPLVTMPPRSQTVNVGDTVTFNVMASGDKPMSYRWMFNGQEISGAAASSLVVTNVTRFESGSYLVVVSNPVGTVTSAPPAILTIKTTVDCPGVPAGLAGWWRGEHNSSDYAGTNDAVWNGAKGYGMGEVGGAFVLDGQSSYLEIHDSKAWNFETNDFSIELWANFSTVIPSDMGADGSSVFLGHNEGPGLHNKWFFGFGGQNIYLYVRSPGAAGQFLAKAPFYPEAQRWYHLALIRGAGVFRTYINGAQKGIEMNAVAIPDANAPLRIGESQGFLMDGMLDEISIYHRALSFSEIQAIYQAGGAGKCQGSTSNLIMHGRMNSNDQFELTIEGGIPGTVMIIQSSPDLTRWQNREQITKSHNSELFTDSSARVGMLFYRVLVNP